MLRSNTLVPTRADLIQGAGIAATTPAPLSFLVPITISQ